MNEIESESVYDTELSKKLENLKNEEHHLNQVQLQLQMQVSEAIHEDKLNESAHNERMQRLESELTSLKCTFETLVNGSVLQIEKRQLLGLCSPLEKELIKLKQQRDDLMLHLENGNNPDENRIEMMETKVLQTMQQSLSQLKEKVIDYTTELEKKQELVAHAHQELNVLQEQKESWTRLQNDKKCAICTKK